MRSSLSTGEREKGVDELARAVRANTATGAGEHLSDDAVRGQMT